MTKFFRADCLVKAAFLLSAVPASLLSQGANSNSYLVHNLVSDLAGIADHQDANLINPWGNGFGATPFWIGNNGTGTATLYDGTGAVSSLIVTIPQAGKRGQCRAGNRRNFQFVRI